MLDPVLKEFMWAIERSISETARVQNDTSQIKDQCTGIQEGDQEFKEERDNTIYNIGVKDGAAGLVDHLHANGYTIIHKGGEVVNPKHDETGVIETFSQTFFTDELWHQVSN